MSTGNTGYELFYSDGGHGGPYWTMAAAVDAAQRRLSGCAATRSVSIHPRTKDGVGGYGPCVNTVTREQTATIRSMNKELEGLHSKFPEYAEQIDHNGRTFSFRGEPVCVTAAYFEAWLVNVWPGDVVDDDPQPNQMAY